eukprot:4306522-Amphidinium_carterae.3
MDAVTSQAAVLNINVTRGDETQQLPTNLVVWKIAGRPPQIKEGHRCIRLSGNTTQVISLKITKAAQGKGVWIPPVLTTFLDGSLTFGNCLPVPGMETTQVFLARVLQADLHTAMAEGAQAGLQVIGRATNTDAIKVLWLKAQNLADARKEAADLICELPEDSNWRRASALCLRQEKNKLSYGVRVRAEEYFKVASAAGKDQRKRFVLTGCLQSWISCDVQTVCQRLEWRAEVLRQLNKRTWLVVADEEPVVWRQLVESGNERTTIWIRAYEERGRRQTQRAPEMRNGQRSWASVVKGPAEVIPQHQHEDHEKDFWSLRDSDDETEELWTASSDDNSGKEVSTEEASDSWTGWWQHQKGFTPTDTDEPMEDQAKRLPDDDIEDGWVEVSTKKQRRQKVEAEKRVRANLSTTESEEEQAKKQPKLTGDARQSNGVADAADIQEIMQELRTEKAQLRAENRELKAKLDELLARLASTAVDGDHIETDETTGLPLTFTRTFSSEASMAINKAAIAKRCAG